MSGGGGVAYVAHLGGLFFGYVYVKFVSRGLGKLGLSERYYGIRNSYYRWKRRRAARKFEVYMKDHDRKVTFDEHGITCPRRQRQNEWRIEVGLGELAVSRQHPAVRKTNSGDPQRTPRFLRRSFPAIPSAQSSL